MGGISTTTYLEVRNETDKDFTTSISEIDNYDWGSDFRPDHNFHHVLLKKKSSLRKREDINALASWCPFRMTLYFTDGSIDSFRIHQRFAVGDPAHFQHSPKSHQITYEKGSGKELIITVENTLEQNQNEEAETLNQEGETALRLRLFESAVSKFEEAISLAKKWSTIKKIEKNLNEAKIFKLNEEGKALEDEKKFEEALAKYDEALKLAKDKLFTDVLEQNKTKAMTLFGKSLYEEAWILETEDNLEQAGNKLQKSKNILKNIPGQEATLKLVELKISANQLYTLALEEDKKALVLFEGAKKSQSADFAPVKNKYREVLKLYEDAAGKLDQGTAFDQKFSDRANFVRRKISAVQKKIEEVGQAEAGAKVEIQ